MHEIQAKQNDLKGGKLTGFVDLIFVKNGMKPLGNGFRRFGDIRHYVCDKNIALSNLLMAAYNDMYIFCEPYRRYTTRWTRLDCLVLTSHDNKQCARPREKTLQDTNF